jgi:hypothetical protein
MKATTIVASAFIAAIAALGGLTLSSDTAEANRGYRHGYYYGGFGFAPYYYAPRRYYGHRVYYGPRFYRGYYGRRWH